MTEAHEYPAVRLELRTGNPPRGCAFDAELLGWGPERVDTLSISDATGFGWVDPKAIVSTWD